MARESTRERRARTLRETFEGQYGDHSQRELVDVIFLALREIEDLEEQKKDSADTFKDLIKEKKNAIQYCRERYDHIISEGIGEEADRILAAA